MKYGIRLLGIIYFGLTVNMANAQNNAVGLSIIQDEHEYKISSNNQLVKLKPEGFKLLFNSFAYTDKIRYAIEIDAFTDTKGLALIHDGVKIEDIPYFTPGTGMACDMGKEYECLYIDKDLGQCHYIFYQENGDSRAKLEGRKADTLRLSWDIKKIALTQKKETSIKKAEIKDLYLVVLNDFNQNGIVDAGEYIIVHISFE